MSRRQKAVVFLEIPKQIAIKGEKEKRKDTQSCHVVGVPEFIYLGSTRPLFHFIIVFRGNFVVRGANYKSNTLRVLIYYFFLVHES